MNTVNPQIADPIETVDPLARDTTPELIIGLVGPLGSDLSTVHNTIEEALRIVGYNTVEIGLSNGLTEVSVGVVLKNDFEDNRIETYMQAGTKLRNKLKRGDALALMAMAQIRATRQKITGQADTPAPKTAYILRSLKHRDEVDTLRRVYGRLFYLVSVYLPKQKRIENLARKIAISHCDSKAENHAHRAEKLVQIDQQEEGAGYGQDVSGAFPLADLFIDIQSVQKATRDIERFIEILFGHPFHTPTKDEFGMYMARASALRSADLSRQVGAAVMTQDGGVIASGCNEVPKFGGGMYWSDDNPEIDNRDFRRGYDSSARMKTDLITEFVARLKAMNLLDSSVSGKTPAEIALHLMKNEAFKEIQAANILEFGRIVHAEMAAITDAARRGIMLQAATLYTTTFPCHMCARHIIISGVERVVYIEPYPKSRAAALYDDSIVVDAAYPTKNRLRFEPFVGVAPRSYIRLFEMRKRKDSKDAQGGIIKWSPSKPQARFSIIKPAYVALEANCVIFIGQEIKKHGLNNSTVANVTP